MQCPFPRKVLLDHILSQARVCISYFQFQGLSDTMAWEAQGAHLALTQHNLEVQVRQHRGATLDQ